MRPYLAPRRTGIDRLDIYIDGYARYLQDRGETRLTMTSLDGTEPYEAARSAVIRQIDGGYPIPTLILEHQSPAMEDYVWHWFLLNGYDDTDDQFLVKAVSGAAASSCTVSTTKPRPRSRRRLMKRVEKQPPHSREYSRELGGFFLQILVT